MINKHIFIYKSKYWTYRISFSLLNLENYSSKLKFNIFNIYIFSCKFFYIMVKFWNINNFFNNFKRIFFKNFSIQTKKLQISFDFIKINFIFLIKNI